MVSQATLPAMAVAGDAPVIGANNTTYSPQNFSGKWRLREADGNLCQIDLQVTDASPHKIKLRGCSHKAIKAASQWELQLRDLVIMDRTGQTLGVFKVTEPNKLETNGMIIFR